MPKYEIWMSGYLCTGMEGIPSKAKFEGRFEGETFTEACVNWSKTLEEPHFFNKDTLSYWGCGLYDNETDARKSFG